jgi:hypothetical protein
MAESTGSGSVTGDSPTAKHPNWVTYRWPPDYEEVVTWQWEKDVVKAYMDIDFQGIMSIENEDPILAGEVGVERAVFVLKNVRAELLEGK